MLVNSLNYNVEVTNTNQKQNKNYYFKCICQQDSFEKNNLVSFSGKLEPLFFDNIAKLIKNGKLKTIEKISNLGIINDDLKSFLHISAEEKQVKISKFLLDKGFDINQKDKSGKTPFSIACANQDEKTIDLYLDYNADINTKDNIGNTPLHNAINNPKTLGILLDKGANPYIKNEFGLPVLQEATTNTKALEYLLKRGINPDSINDEEQTILHMASIDGNKKLADLLLKYNAEKNFRDKNGKSPVFYSKNSETVKYWIEKGVNPNLQDKNDRTALFDFVERNDPKSIIELVKGGGKLNIPDKNDRTAILYVRNNAIRELLLMCGADPNVKMKDGKTLLHLAVQNNNKEAVSTLLKYRAKVKALDKNGKAPLYYAQNNTIRKILLNNGANPDDELYLHWSLKTNNEEFFNDLLKTDIDVNVEDFKGKTPIFYCKKAEDVIKLAQKKADINYKDKEGNTPLHNYLSIGNTEMADVLKELGANAKLRNKSGETPYDLAEMWGKYSSWIK